MTDPMQEQLALLMETNRKQSEVIASQAKTIEELRATIVELNASLAWLKRKVFGKMSEKCNPINNGDPMLPFDYGDLGQIEAEIEAARNKAAQIITPKPAYDAFENRKDVCLCGCLAHIRRHIESCREENREYAMQGLKFIQDLYNVEYMADERQLSYEERAVLRQRLAGPLLDAFELWLQNTYPKVLKRSLMGKAIAYAYPFIPRVKHYLYDGRIFIDNNRAENAFRPMVLTRKNMLFCGNQQAAENTAVICSLLGSCKECGVNPRILWILVLHVRSPVLLFPALAFSIPFLYTSIYRFSAAVQPAVD